MRQETFGHYQRSSGYGSEVKVAAALERWGPNAFEVPLPQFGELLQEQLVAPFFVFQVFCVGLWCLDDYWCAPAPMPFMGSSTHHNLTGAWTAFHMLSNAISMAGVPSMRQGTGLWEQGQWDVTSGCPSARRYYSLFTLGMLVMFECTVVGQRLRNLRELRALTVPKQALQVYRQGRWAQLPGDALLPGDLISIGRPSGGAARAGSPVWMLPVHASLLGCAGSLVWTLPVHAIFLACRAGCRCACRAAMMAVDGHLLCHN